MQPHGPAVRHPLRLHEQARGAVEGRRKHTRKRQWIEGTRWWRRHLLRLHHRPLREDLDDLLQRDLKGQQCFEGEKSPVFA